MTISDPLPAGTSYQSVGGQGSATVSGQTVTLTIGNLAVDASSTSTIVVNVASTTLGTITNTATVIGNQPDPNMANNTASASTLVTAPVIPVSADALIITKAVNLTQVTTGSDLTYTVTVTNGSLAQVTGVTAADPLPAGFTYLSSSIQYSPTSAAVPYSPTSSAGA